MNITSYSRSDTATEMQIANTYCGTIWRMLVKTVPFWSFETEAAEKRLAAQQR